ncbi:MAG: methionine--tRNA ligase [Gammaproteobacteria bacterium]|nr:methionine--tRNA ligase [Gammaproteobacteria bacterium]
MTAHRRTFCHYLHLIFWYHYGFARELYTMSTKSKKILVTAALPYANGEIHLGHMVEHIQADIWVRFQKMKGHTCLFICGDDAHGTAISLRAEREGTSPEEMIQTLHQAHKTDLQDFLIEFDNYYTTHSDENKQLVYQIYEKLEKAGAIFTQEVEQAYDAIKHVFLPDRYVKGTCPKCDAPDQYGDNCEKCGAAYSPTELKHPLSTLTQTPPILKKSLHYFFDLPKYEKFLKNWIHSGTVSSPVAHKLNEWLQTGLQPWDISRDAPYFGFPIPHTENKYFYVWLDAPVGYMASTLNLTKKNHAIHFSEFWENDKTELYHFIGKDIVYFHALFWPAMLKEAGYRLPSAIFTHGFLTVDNQKMSKSRGTYINARTYLNHFSPEYLRYYYASKLTSGAEDIDLNLQDFMLKINSDLVGKVINIGSRLAALLKKHFHNQLRREPVSHPLWLTIIAEKETIEMYYTTRDYSKAARLIMNLADKINAYIDEYKPWLLAKDPASLPKVHEVCSLGLNLFKVLITYLKPILPLTAARVELFLNTPSLNWANLTDYLTHTLNDFEPLMQRIDHTRIQSMTDAAQTHDTPSDNPAAVSAIEPIKPLINYDKFDALDLRIVKIIKAEAIPEANKLLKLTVDIGSGTRQIFAGIKRAYTPEQLEGKLTVIVANLEPRQMRFGLSEGMLVLAGDGQGLWLLEPHDGAQPGMPVK